MYSRGYREVADKIYKLYMKEYSPESSRWGDKNNFFLHHVDTIDKIFPDALFIHIVRDGRDVACSYRDLKNMKGKYAPRLPAIVGDVAHRWVDNLKAIEDSLNRIDYRRSFIIRYEDLVNDPEQTLCDLCLFIKETFCDWIFAEMMAFSERNKKEKLEPDITMKWKGLTKRPITNSRVGRWKKELTKDEQELFSFIARDKLIKYGYK
jgi:hypothetical protein